MTDNALNLKPDELVEDQVNDTWEEPSSDTVIPLTEEAIQDGIENYYQSLLENTTEEEIQEIISHVDKYTELCDEFEKHVNESFDNLPEELTPDVIKSYRFPVDDERSKNFYEKVNPVLSFLVENERIDKSVLEKAHDAFKRGYVASLLGTSLYTFNPNEEQHISSELSKALEHTAYQLLSFQLENSLRVLVIQRRNNALTKDFIDMVRTQVNKVIDVTESYLSFNQLNTEVIEENRDVVNRLIDKFIPFIREETSEEKA